MRIPLSSEELLNREFLEIRGGLLRLAASLDRLDRAGGSAPQDPRLAKVQEGLRTLESQSSDRAERIQMIFSREYEEGWRAKLELHARG